jgi:uncharacterized membrane protein YvbJ
MASCQNCGAALANTDIFCGKCGAPVTAQSIPLQPTASKNKVVSILLAVFLTFWTWLYTYKRDWWKFWLGLIISSVPILVILAMVMTFSSTNSDNTFVALGLPSPDRGMVVGYGGQHL